MYVLVAYDVEAGRTERFRKLLSRYLAHEQFSVFAGSLSAARLRALEAALSQLMTPGDRVFQVLSPNRQNVSVRILKKALGNEAMMRAEHDHHKTDASIL